MDIYFFLKSKNVYFVLNDFRQALLATSRDVTDYLPDDWLSPSLVSAALLSEICGRDFSTAAAATATAAPALMRTYHMLCS